MSSESAVFATHDKSDYYAKRGWNVLERFEGWGKEQWLMSREL